MVTPEMVTPEMGSFAYLYIMHFVYYVWCIFGYNLCMVEAFLFTLRALHCEKVTHAHYIYGNSYLCLIWLFENVFSNTHTNFGKAGSQKMVRIVIFPMLHVILSLVCKFMQKNEMTYMAFVLGRGKHFPVIISLPNFQVILTDTCWRQPIPIGSVRSKVKVTNSQEPTAGHICNQNWLL